MSLNYVQKHNIIENINKLDEFQKHQLYKIIQKKYPDVKIKKSKSNILLSVNDDILLDIKDNTQFMLDNNLNDFKKNEDIKKELELELNKTSVNNTEYQYIDPLEKLLNNENVKTFYNVAKILLERNKNEEKIKKPKNKNKKLNIKVVEDRIRKNLKRIHRESKPRENKKNSDFYNVFNVFSSDYNSNSISNSNKVVDIIDNNNDYNLDVLIKKKENESNPEADLEEEEIIEDEAEFIEDELEENGVYDFYNNIYNNILNENEVELELSGAEENESNKSNESNIYIDKIRVNKEKYTNYFKN